MILKFKFGVTFEGINYGWKDKKLFRLPQYIGNRFMPLKELKLIKVGNKKGYNLNKKKKSLDQLESMSIFINQEIQLIKDKDCPF